MNGPATTSRLPSAPAGRCPPHSSIRFAALLVLALGALLTARGLWIPAKAHLAQLLLARAWNEARAGAARPRPWPWADTWPVARLRVPALGVDQIVLAGATGSALAFAPGHVTGTAPPGGDGNTALAGHRDTHFRFLRELRPGHELLLDTPDGATHRYRVRETFVTDHRDTTPLAPAAAPALTLVTCYPFDALAPGGPLRYVVRGVESG